MINFGTDYVYPAGLGFQNPATFVMTSLIELHDYIMLILIFILGIVGWFIAVIFYKVMQRVATYPDLDTTLKTPSMLMTHYRKKNGSLFSKAAFVENVEQILLDYPKQTSGLDETNIREISSCIIGVVGNIYKKSDLKKDSILEFLWTIFPGLLLLGIALPSLNTLYAPDNIIDQLLSDSGSLTIKIMGHQWFWSYEYTTKFNELVNFNSYMVLEEDLIPGDLRLLEVDNPLIVPANKPLRLLITSDDVIHSWAVPSLGVKMDAIPGRLNEVFTIINRPGTFYGQCSEICGVNHAFMPIKVVALKEIVE